MIEGVEALTGRRLDDVLDTDTRTLKEAQLVQWLSHVSCIVFEISSHEFCFSFILSIIDYVPLCIRTCSEPSIHPCLQELVSNMLVNH